MLSQSNSVSAVMRRLATFAILAIGAVSTVAQAETIHVYGGESIQAAITGAMDGDEIVVHPGTFNETIDLLGKQVYLHSSDGYEVTSISGLGVVGSVITCDSGETANTVIEGFTVLRGSGGTVIGDHGLGAGLFVVDSSPTLTDCVVRLNVLNGSADVMGAGAYFLRSGSTVSGCGFLNNSASTDLSDGQVMGGGAAVIDSSMTFSDCVFDGNALDHAYVRWAVQGAGLYTTGSALNLDRCTFHDNRVNLQKAGSGGGLHSEGADSVVSMVDCTFEQNEAYLGGGIAAGLGAQTYVNDSMFVDNFSKWQGGGLYLSSAGHTAVDHCLFKWNRAHYGGGIWADETTYAVSGTEFYANSVTEDGGAMYSRNSQYECDRCAYWRNSNIGHGGAVYGTGSSGVFRKCRFEDNRSSYSGGAIYNSLDGDVLCDNSLFIANLTSYNGAGLYSYYGNVVINCCTFARNHAIEDGQAFYLFHATSLVTNSIFWNNSGYYGTVYEGGSRQIQYCITNTYGIGNIAADPLFAEPHGYDFRLTAGSPAIDAGSNDFISQDMLTDYADNPRRADDPATKDAGVGMPPRVDMGVFEFPHDALTHCEPYPGKANADNSLIVVNATPTELVYFVYGLHSGTTPVPGCQGLAVDIAQASLVDTRAADDSGRASVDVFVPKSASGHAVYFQAVQRSNCTTSNRVDWVFSS